MNSAQYQKDTVLYSMIGVFTQGCVSHIIEVKVAFGARDNRRWGLGRLTA